ncbi:hypothetical protein OA435_00455 [Pelagibacteraceae bacterium]|nr:hypothetical protein [Pelagibacteraceae bacterium]
MKKLLIILCTLFFSSNLYAFDFSGTYQGIECRGVCKEDSKLDEFARSLPLIGLFKGSDKIGLLIVEHNESDQTITIFAPRLNYIFADMKLNGNFFKGPATNKSNKNNTIEGNISKGKIDATIFKANTEQNWHYVASLTLRDAQFNNFKEEFDDLEKKLKKLQSDLSDTNTDVKNRNQSIKDLETDIDNLQKQKEDEVAKLNDDIDLLKKTLDTLKKKPPKINVSPIEMTDKISCDAVNLRSVNSDNAKKYKTLNKDQKVRLLSITDGIWALIITEEGLIGYALNSCINSLDDVAVVQPVVSGPNAINVYEPCKILKSNDPCNIDGSGIVTVQGTINMKKIKAIEVLVNDDVADLDSAGNFEIILFDVEPGANDITISALDSEGKRKELSFILNAN